MGNYYRFENGILAILVDLLSVADPQGKRMTTWHFDNTDKKDKPHAWWAKGATGAYRRMNGGEMRCL
jgi:hypothetical protein